MARTYEKRTPFQRGVADFVHVLRLLGSWESVTVARRKNALAGSYTASVAGSSLGCEVSSSTDLNKT